MSGDADHEVARDCPFCAPDPSRIFHTDEHILGLWDAFPVAAGHALLITKRHVASIFDASPREQRALLDGVEVARKAIFASQAAHPPDAFNIGINVGEAAGQTVPHVHVHVIPRREGDCEDPRGGIRWVLPERAAYWEKP